MKILMALIFSLIMLMSVTNAIPTYKQCLECFYANRTNFYYCQQTTQCLPMRSTACPSNQIIFRDFQCVEGYQLCTNVTFSHLSVGSKQQLGYGLPAGQGCYIQIDRARNGSYGTLAINYDDPSILVFDSQQRNYQPGQILGLPLTDFGWGPRRVFVVNKGEQPAGFMVEFVGGVLSTSISLGLLLCLSFFTFFY